MNRRSCLGTFVVTLALARRVVLAMLVLGLSASSAHAVPIMLSFDFQRLTSSMMKVVIRRWLTQ